MVLEETATSPYFFNGHKAPTTNHSSTTHKTKRRPTKRQYQTIKEGPAHKVDLPTHLVLAVVVSTIHGAAMRRARPRIRCSPPHLPDKSFFRPRSPPVDLRPFAAPLLFDAARHASVALLAWLCAECGCCCPDCRACELRPMPARAVDAMVPLKDLPKHWW